MLITNDINFTDKNGQWSLKFTDDVIFSAFRQIFLSSENTSRPSKDKKTNFTRKGQGTGYGESSQRNPRDKDMFDTAAVKQIEIDRKLSHLLFGLNHLLTISGPDPRLLCDRIQRSKELRSFFVELLNNNSLLDIGARTVLYQNLLNLLSSMLSEPLLLPYIYHTSDYFGGSSLFSLITVLNEQVSIFLNLHEQVDKVVDDSNTEIEEALLIALHIQQIFNSMASLQSLAAEPSADSEKQITTTAESADDMWKVEEASEYTSKLRPLRFEAISLCDMICEGKVSHEVLKKQSKAATRTSPASIAGNNSSSLFLKSSSGHAGVVGNARVRLLRIASEMSSLAASLPVEHSASIFLRCDEARMDILKALIIGPEGTPYENGCFEFDIMLPADYPNSPPEVLLVTTGTVHKYSIHCVGFDTFIVYSIRRREDAL